MLTIEKSQCVDKTKQTPFQPALRPDSIFQANVPGHPTGDSSQHLACRELEKISASRDTNYFTMLNFIDLC